jgi:hypothetical protein
MSEAERKITALDGVRAFGVMLAGPVVLMVGAAASAGSAARSLRRREAPRPLAAAGVAVTLSYALVARPRFLSWGATWKERWKPLPGDSAGSRRPGATRAITIDAPVEAVWPWLAQIGQDRGGFYSYEWLENLSGCRMRNADEIHPEWQSREVGETVYLHWASGLPVTVFEPNRALGLGNWGVFVLEPLEDGRTRLIARDVRRPGLRFLADLPLELPHFVMERKMLLGIKERAERAYWAADAAAIVAEAAEAPARDPHLGRSRHRVGTRRRRASASIEV